MRVFAIIAGLNLLAAGVSEAQTSDPSLPCNEVCRAWMQLTSPSEVALPKSPSTSVDQHRVSGAEAQKSSKNRQRPGEAAASKQVVPLPKPRSLDDGDDVATATSAPAPGIDLPDQERKDVDQKDVTASVTEDARRDLALIPGPVATEDRAAGLSLPEDQTPETAVPASPTETSPNPSPENQVASRSSSKSEASGDHTKAENPDGAQPSVAVLYIKTPIDQVADIFGPVAVDSKYRAMSERIEYSLKAAGLRNPRLSIDSEQALTRLVDNSVFAAVVAVVDASVADVFPEVPGYRKFKLSIR